MECLTCVFRTYKLADGKTSRGGTISCWFIGVPIHVIKSDTLGIIWKVLNPRENKRFDYLAKQFHDHSENVQKEVNHAIKIHDQFRKSYTNLVIVSHSRWFHLPEEFESRLGDCGESNNEYQQVLRGKPSIQPGNWLLELPAFKELKDMSNGKRVLWCHRKRGSLSTLASGH